MYPLGTPIFFFLIKTELYKYNTEDLLGFPSGKTGCQQERYYTTDLTCRILLPNGETRRT